MRDDQSAGNAEISADTNPEIAALAQRVATARGKLPLQTDPALFDELSESEIAAERDLSEWIRAQRRDQRRRAVAAELAAEKRDRRVALALRRSDDADARWHRKALAARRRVSNPDARLAQLYRRAEWSSRALIGVVVLGMVWAGVNVQHNLVPSGDMSDPLYWLSYGFEAMISIPIITIMVVATTAARWGREIARGKVVFLEAALLGVTIALNAGPHLASGAPARAAEAAVAPVMVGVVIWLHAWVSARYAQLIDAIPDQSSGSHRTVSHRIVDAFATPVTPRADDASRLLSARYEYSHASDEAYSNGYPTQQAQDEIQPEPPRQTVNGQSHERNGSRPEATQQTVNGHSHEGGGNRLEPTQQAMNSHSHQQNGSHLEPTQQTVNGHSHEGNRDGLEATRRVVNGHSHGRNGSRQPEPPMHPVNGRLHQEGGGPAEPTVNGHSHEVRGESGSTARDSTESNGHAHTPGSASSIAGQTYPLPATGPADNGFPAHRNGHDVTRPAAGEHNGARDGRINGHSHPHAGPRPTHNGADSAHTSSGTEVPAQPPRPADDGTAAGPAEPPATEPDSPAELAHNEETTLRPEDHAPEPQRRNKTRPEPKATAEHPYTRRPASPPAEPEVSEPEPKPRARKEEQSGTQLALDEPTPVDVSKYRRPYAVTTPEPVVEEPDSSPSKTTHSDLVAEIDNVGVWAVAREISERRLSKLPVEQLAEILTLADESWTPAAIGATIGLPGSRILGILDAARRIRRPYVVSG